MLRLLSRASITWASSRMVVDHPPGARSVRPHRGEGADAVGPSTAGEHESPGDEREVFAQRSNFDVLVAEILGRLAVPPEALPHPFLDQRATVLDAPGSHLGGVALVHVHVHGELAAIPADCGGVEPGANCGVGGRW